VPHALNPRSGDVDLLLAVAVAAGGEQLVVVDVGVRAAPAKETAALYLGVYLAAVGKTSRTRRYGESNHSDSDGSGTSTIGRYAQMSSRVAGPAANSRGWPWSLPEMGAIWMRSDQSVW